MSEVKEIKEITARELPAGPNDHWAKAKASVERSNHKYAIKFLQAILREAPGFLEGRRLLRSCEVAALGIGGKKKGLFGSSGGSGGLSMMKLQGSAKKDPAAAMEEIEKALEKDPYSAGYNELLHDAAFRLNLLDTAAFALETVRKGNPENTKLLHKLAEFYMARNMPTESAEVYADIQRRDPTDGAAIKGGKDASARASMQKGKWDSKDGSSSRADTKGDKEREDSTRTGLTRDQLEDRAAQLAARYEANSEDLATVKKLADVYEQLEDWPSAHQFYEWAFKLSKGDVALKHKAAFMKDKANDYRIGILEAELAKDPDNETLQAQLKETKHSMLAERLEECRKRVDQNPTDPQLRFDLGEALYKAGEYSDAIPHLQQATRNPHIRTRVLLLLGRTFDAKGMTDLAIKQLSDANSELVAMDGTKKQILYELGLIYSKAGQKEKGLECFKQIYEVDYGYRDVAQRVEGSYSED